MLLSYRYANLTTVLEIFLFGFIICGAISAAVGIGKNRSGLGSFCWGFFLGIIGIIIVAVLPQGIPPAPAGMRSLTCVRCNARQNVPLAASSFPCWQCHTTNGVNPVLLAENQRRREETTSEWLQRIRRENEEHGQ